MFTRRILGAFALLLAFGVGSAVAQVSAVIVTRDGERVRGSLVDMNARGFEVSVNGTSRWITPGDVAAISFGGDVTDEQFNVASAGNAVVVLRSGQRVTGNLYDISGRSPLNIVVRNSAGEREIQSNDVARIIFARPSTVAPAPDPTPGAGGGPGLVVAANRQWTPTNITVRRGQTVTIASTGQIRLSANQRDLASVNGSLNQSYDAGSPLPQFLEGALIGRVGNGQPFAIGSQTSIEMPASGILYLGINDDDVSDNAGHFNVEVTQQRRRR